MASYLVTTSLRATVSSDGSDLPHIAGETYLSDADALTHLRGIQLRPVYSSSGDLLCAFAPVPTPAEQAAMDARLVQAGAYEGMTRLVVECDRALVKYANHPHVLQGCPEYTALASSKTRPNLDAFLSHMASL